MQFIDAQGARETLQDHRTVLGQVEAGQLPAQAIVEKAIGQLQEEVVLEGDSGLLDVETVEEETTEDGLQKLEKDRDLNSLRSQAAFAALLKKVRPAPKTAAAEEP